MAFCQPGGKAKMDFFTRENPVHPQRMPHAPMVWRVSLHRVGPWMVTHPHHPFPTRMSDLPRIQNPADLRTLAQNPSQACTCALKNCAGWTPITETQWPQAQLPAVADLRDPDVAEPTFEEHHPHGTRYGDAQAPVSLAHFPANRCVLHACRVCGQHVLRYTEFGGYYVDHRARRLDPEVVTDTPESK